MTGHICFAIIRSDRRYSMEKKDMQPMQHWQADESRMVPERQLRAEEVALQKNQGFPAEQEIPEDQGFPETEDW